MKEHLRMLEESDSDDGKARKKKKKVKKQVCSDDEEVQVIKRKDFPTVEGMKAFEEEEASEEKNSEKKKDTEIKISGKKQGVSYNKCPPPLENGYSP
ncbi:hypothetical protein Hdeb2414_s0094g00790061 [Helianthus debilis subsp. tardiflorus]